MEIETYSDLEKSYSKYFDSKTFKKINCGSGWFNIISNLLYTIDLYYEHEEEEVRNNKCLITKIEERFGCLNIEFTGDSDRIYNNLIQYTMIMSRKICEYCGKDGNLYCSTQSLHWSDKKTLCIPHAVKMKYYSIK